MSRSTSGPKRPPMRLPMPGADCASRTRWMAAMGAAAVLLALAAPASAQNEDALRAFFEGKQVTVKIDMPGTSDGVDVKADAKTAIDYPRYGDRIKRFGVAIHTGEPATVTLVKVKKDLIEFQLSGGGFGTFGDDTSTTVYMPYVDPSAREKELKKKIKDETDPHRKREMQSELDDLVSRRERQNRRIDDERARLEEQKRLRIADERLHGGSRFNVRYSGAVPAGIRPEEVMAALAAYVDFTAFGVAAPADSRGVVAPAVPAPPPAPVAPADGGAVPRKGMSRAEAERAFGPARESTERREGGMAITTLVFLSGDQRISADFVEDVLVRYTITSR